MSCLTRAVTASSSPVFFVATGVRLDLHLLVANATNLVAADLLSVVLFPLTALTLLGSGEEQSARCPRGGAVSRPEAERSPALELTRTHAKGYPRRARRSLSPEGAMIGVGVQAAAQ